MHFMAYSRGRLWWHLPAPACTTQPTASSPANLPTTPRCGDVRGWLVEGVWYWGGVALIRQWMWETRCSTAESFNRWPLLTFRSLCTMPFVWQWFTLSTICCMQWLEGDQARSREERERENGSVSDNTWSSTAVTRWTSKRNSSVFDGEKTCCSASCFRVRSRWALLKTEAGNSKSVKNTATW